MNTKEDQSGQHTLLPININFIPIYVLEAAEIQLNESTSNKIKGLNDLKVLLKADKYTEDIVFEDDFLLQYLRRFSYDAALAFPCVRNFTKLRRKHAEIFNNFGPDYFSIPSSQFYTLLPYRCPEGCSINLFQVGKWEPREFSFEDTRRLCMRSFLQQLRDPLTQIAGFKAIYDCENTGFKYLKHCTLQNFLLGYHILMDCVPGVYKEVHVVNTSFVVSGLWKMCRPFLSESILKIVFFHSSVEKLLDFFPATVLPNQYGGSLTEYQMTDWLRRAVDECENFPLAGLPNLY